jgi:hypothetical protein
MKFLVINGLLILACISVQSQNLKKQNLKIKKNDNKQGKGSCYQ